MLKSAFLLLPLLADSFQPPYSKAPFRTPQKFAAVTDAPSIEDEVLEVLGDGKVSLSNDEENRLNRALGGAAGRPTPAPSAPLIGNWELLYTTKSDFDIANPLGKRSDGTAPGLEQIFTALGGDRATGAGASSSPIQRLVTGLESVRIYQNVELESRGRGRVDQLVKGPDGSTILRLSASAAYDENMDRINFMFDLAYFVVLGVRIPYPVPFKLLGDEAGGYLDTKFVSEKIRVSKGNKGTTFILRKVK
mmetsp:Transcript_5962/g.12483  ORF Transcript_5962/g.12483 Transcript_5962/m.12483 type:complete len:249 (+) Transcript_5962:49-795(+)|eukprot:CAMPEP_0194304532 /NCGR_PEP_ID=MMETSP0171-20130528/2268_1 /TAXON_ID=218684 /ORGANISM="Corethron pennatum, Strain L29A3" /LENGTH=248 /DNA_ID=CAMNT_0039055851 /DNA_START=26 /DNA_END=772 /DNA_ORIENTATION=-